MVSYIKPTRVYTVCICIYKEDAVHLVFFKCSFRMKRKAPQELYGPSVTSPVLKRCAMNPSFVLHYKGSLHI